MAPATVSPFHAGVSRAWKQTEGSRSHVRRITAAVRLRNSAPRHSRRKARAERQRGCTAMIAIHLADPLTVRRKQRHRNIYPSLLDHYVQILTVDRRDFVGM